MSTTFPALAAAVSAVAALGHRRRAVRREPRVPRRRLADAGRRFQSGPLYAGPRVWLGNLNGAVAVGGQIEKGLTEPGKYGAGIISGGIGADYYSWSSTTAGRSAAASTPCSPCRRSATTTS